MLSLVDDYEALSKHILQPKYKKSHSFLKEKYYFLSINFFILFTIANDN